MNPFNRSPLGGYRQLIDSDFSLDSVISGIGRVVELKTAYDSSRYAIAESKASLATRQSELSAQTAIAQIDANARVELSKLQAAREMFNFSNMGRAITSTDFASYMPYVLGFGAVAAAFIAFRK